LERINQWLATRAFVKHVPNIHQPIPLVLARLRLFQISIIMTIELSNIIIGAGAIEECVCNTAKGWSGPDGGPCTGGSDDGIISIMCHIMLCYDSRPNTLLFDV
jgi:hypothetical protein